MRWWPVK